MIEAMFKLMLAILGVVLCLVFFTGLGHGQAAPALEARLGDKRPRLELEPRANFFGGGFQPVSASMTAGVGMEGRFIWHVYGTYIAARKLEHTDTADNTNPHGNIRSVGAQVGFRTDGGLLFLAQASYASLRTTNFDKVGVGAAVGMGKDFFNIHCPNCNNRGGSLRFTAMYALPLRCVTYPSFHCNVPTVDVEQGAIFNVTIPSPIETNRPAYLPYFHVLSSVGIIKTSEHGAYTHDASAVTGLIWRF